MRDLYSTHTGTGVALSLFTAPASAPYRHGIVHYHHYQLADGSEDRSDQFKHGREQGNGKLMDLGLF